MVVEHRRRLGELSSSRLRDPRADGAPSARIVQSM
jgi:hypothetical protein